VAKGLLPYHGLGSGIKRALSLWPKIEFTDDRDGCLFTATVHRIPSKVQLPEQAVGASGGASGGVSGGVNTAANLLTLAKTHPGLNVADLVRLSEKPQRTIERWLKQLKDQDLIEFKGATKTGGYYSKVSSKT
jgi:ATP-dependent DNA helicase RecG